METEKTVLVTKTQKRMYINNTDLTPADYVEVVASEIDHGDWIIVNVPLDTHGYKFELVAEKVRSIATYENGLNRNPELKMKAGELRFYFGSGNTASNWTYFDMDDKVMVVRPATPRWLKSNWICPVCNQSTLSQIVFYDGQNHELKTKCEKCDYIKIYEIFVD